MAQYTLEIYRGASVVESHKVQDDTVLNARFFGESQITSRIETNTVLDVAIGDYIRWGNLKYYINQQPSIIKNSSNNFIYDIIFESQYYDFIKAQYLNSTSGEFFLTSNAEGFIDLIITNMNRVAGSTLWTKGTIDQTDATYKNLHFKDQNCRSVIQTICQEFSGEIYFKNYQINFTDKLENDTGLLLEYRSGLRNISKIAESEKNIQTRVYGYGSDKNLGTSYRSGKQRLEFDDGGNNYLENNVSTFGLIENAITFDEIYPHRTGTVTGVGVVTVFTDSAMDFDVNSYLISGITAKVHFNTGSLAGYEFEIETYTNATKTFTLIPIKTAIGIDELPNATLKPAVTDEYTIVDITMPASYITTAETALEAATQSYLDDNSVARVKYQVKADNRWFEQFGYSFNLGDKFTIVDTDLDINVSVRITELNYPLYDPFEYTIVLSSFVDPTFLQTLYDDNDGLKNGSQIDNGGNIPDAYSNMLGTANLRNIIVAPDGYIRIGLLTADNIITGKMQSVSGDTYFDLDNNTLVIGSGEGSIAGTVITSIEDGADVTASNTAQDIANMLATPAGSGFYCSATNLGYYSGSAWATYMDSSGNFYLKGDAGGSLEWTAGTKTLAITGAITITGGSGIASLTDAGDLAVIDEVNADDGTIGTTVISGGKIITGLLTATNIQTGTLTGRTVQTDTGAVGHYKRAELKGADAGTYPNSIILYDDTDNPIIRIDDTLWHGAYPGIEILHDSGRIHLSNDATTSTTTMGNGAISIIAAAEQGVVFYGRANYTLVGQTNGIYAANIDSGETGNLFVGMSGGGTPSRVFSVDESGDGYFAGDIFMVANKTVDGVDVSAHIHSAAAGQGAKITSTNLLSANTWRLLVSNGSKAIIERALGAAGTVLLSDNGAADFPEWGKVTSTYTTGASGTFLDGEAATITVTNGLVTNIGT